VLPNSELHTGSVPGSHQNNGVVITQFYLPNSFLASIGLSMLQSLFSSVRCFRMKFFLLIFRQNVIELSGLYVFFLQSPLHELVMWSLCFLVPQDLVSYSVHNG
jgi:hypothetical protein